ncbi:MAG: ribosomal protein S18-alanine N-acetyltransferase [Clostridia bacterium]|nr:ribosomal protein S18-alanine N-acetyltransferase [Clostridia bacterium]
MKNLVIDKMTLSDLNEISKNLTSDFDEFWNSSILESELKNPFSQYIIAKLNKEIVGFAGVIDTVDQLEITNIVVKKDYRKNGIGNELLVELITLAKENGKDKIILEVNSTNLAAIKLYEKNGFKNVGFRKKYYNNTYDANIMTLKLK